MVWFKRKESEPRTPIVDEDAIRQAEEELRKSERQLAETVEQTGEVARVSKVIEDIGKRNHLGPSFFDALGIQRPPRSI